MSYIKILMNEYVTYVVKIQFISSWTYVFIHASIVTVMLPLKTKAAQIVLLSA